jgi:hypothetical protein
MKEARSQDQAPTTAGKLVPGLASLRLRDGFLERTPSPARGAEPAAGFRKILRLRAGGATPPSWLQGKLHLHRRPLSFACWRLQYDLNVDLDGSLCRRNGEMARA